MIKVKRGNLWKLFSVAISNMHGFVDMQSIFGNPYEIYSYWWKPFPILSWLVCLAYREIDGKIKYLAVSSIYIFPWTQMSCQKSGLCIWRMSDIGLSVGELHWPFCLFWNVIDFLHSLLFIYYHICYIIASCRCLLKEMLEPAAQ